jgi:serine/threonine protein kinase
MTVMSRLRAGTLLHNDAGTPYLVERLLSEGGFGQTYYGHRLTASGRRGREVCIKVCRSLDDWHGEAYFGRLLTGDERVVGLLDVFVDATGRGPRQRRRHVLVFEYMAEGTVWDAVEEGGPVWSEAKVRREIRALLVVLQRMHAVWLLHRDIKPDNVFLRDGRLVLGDFGIAKLVVDTSPSPVSRLQGDFAPGNVTAGSVWGPHDDIYQVGLLAGTLLSGEVWWNQSVSIGSITALDCSDAFKSWIWHATGAKSKRYLDAFDAVHALSALRQIDMRPGRAPRSLRGHCIVFSGRLEHLPRTEATARARKAGARVQSRVTDSTTVVVLGSMRAGAVGAAEGTKLFGVRERIRTGQPILLIDQQQFARLARRR